MDMQDEIREARDQNRLNIPAKRLMEKLRPIPSNVNDLQHRWFWELLQNASDYNDSVNVVLELYENKIVFMHNGNPFKPSDAENLIAPDSGKDVDELKVQDLIGQFGTGFISTHVVSPVVKVEGVLKSEKHSDQYRKFHFTLDRTAYYDKESLKQTLSRTSEELDKSLIPATYQPEQFDTKFTYDLNASLPNINTKEVVREGLRNLESVLPYTLAFMPKVKSVIIRNYNTDMVNYANRTFRPQSTIDAKTFIVNIHDHQQYVDSVNLRIIYENDAQLVIRVQNNRIIPYPDGITKLFCSLPMIGTEAFGFPLVLNSRIFAPHSERDGVSLTANDAKNRAIFRDAVVAHTRVLHTIVQDKIYNCSCLVKWPTPSFKSDEEGNWYKAEVTDKIKSAYLAAEIVKTANDWITLESAIIPYAPKEAYTDQQLLVFYDLVSVLHAKKLPHKADYLNWYKQLDFSIFTSLSYSLEDFVKELSELGSLDQISQDESIKYEWLNKVLAFVLMKNPDLLDKYRIIPNRLGNFVRRKDPIYWNDDVDSFLFQVHMLMTNEDFEQILVHPKINVVNLFEGERKKTTHDIAKAIDDAFSDYKGNKQDAHFLKALRLTFQWTRESGLPEKELKDLFKWFASHRPQLFLETFNEDDRDKAFSIVQSGKLSSLSKLAESKLTNEDINSMLAIGVSGVDINKMSELAKLSNEVGVEAILTSAKELVEERRELIFKKEIGEHVERILNSIFVQEFPFFEARLERTKEYDILIRNKFNPVKQYYIELKSIRDDSVEPVKVGIHQARKAKDNPNNYALVLIRRPHDLNISEEYLRSNIISDFQIGKAVIDEVNKSEIVDKIVKSIDNIRLEIKDPKMKLHIKQDYLLQLENGFDVLKTKIIEAVN
jgi:hypothetical protein